MLWTGSQCTFSIICSLKIHYTRSGLLVLFLHKHVYLLLTGVAEARITSGLWAIGTFRVLSTLSCVAHSLSTLPTKTNRISPLHSASEVWQNFFQPKPNILLCMQICVNEWISDIHFSFDKDMHLTSFKKCIFIQPFKNNWYHCHNYLLICSAEPGVNYKCKCNQAHYHTFNKQGSFLISIVQGKICVFLLKKLRGVLSQLTSVLVHVGTMLHWVCWNSQGWLPTAPNMGRKKQYLCVLSHWDEKWSIVCRWSAIMDFFVEVLSRFSDCPVSMSAQYALISCNVIKAFYIYISSPLFPAAASTSQVRDRLCVFFFNSLWFLKKEVWNSKSYTQ